MTNCVIVGKSVSQLTLKVVTFSIHEDVVDQNDTKDAGPEMNVTEHKHESNILGEEKEGSSQVRIE